jgi:hypothetical protein
LEREITSRTPKWLCGRRREKGEKTKAKAFLKVVYDLCGKTKTLACLFIGGN